MLYNLVLRKFGYGYDLIGLLEPLDISLPVGGAITIKNPGDEVVACDNRAWQIHSRQEECKVLVGDMVDVIMSLSFVLL